MSRKILALAAKKKTGKKGEKPAVETVDPRSPLAVTPANLTATLNEMRAVVAALGPPEETRRSDLVDALVHIIFAEGLPCSRGQTALQRITSSFVDRNEFRVTEAYETAELLADLEIPDLFARCTAARDSVAEIYNDQNDVSLELLREATVAERNNIFARIPAIPAAANRFLITRLSFEELLFSDRSTVRVQQRLGFDAQLPTIAAFLAELRELLQPFGHIPIEVFRPVEGTRAEEPDSSRELCPTCLLARLGRKK